MPRRKEDIYPGLKIGRITVIREIEKKNKTRRFLYGCSCGSTGKAYISSLRNRGTTSCGCKRRKLFIERNTTHGLSRTSLYKVWQSMRARCQRKTHQVYRHYGGRGINVCEGWNSHFMPFYLWAIENKYKKGLSIERINNDGDYCPENCKWIPRGRQVANTRRSKFYEFMGTNLQLFGWSKLTGIKEMTLFMRLYKGWSIEKTLTTPVMVEYRNGNANL